MPQQGLIFRILVASPGDCIAERKAIPEIIHAWNAAHSLQRGVILEPVLWETHSRPELGDRPQGIINKQLVQNCDILVAAFWTRLGTDTGKAESGTAEEIEEFRRAGKPVLLNFSSVPVVPESIDHAQYQALTEYRERLQSQGLVWRYDSIAAFRDQLYRHLTALESLWGSRDAVTAQPHDPHHLALVTLAQEFETFLRRFQAEWQTERESEPASIDGARLIARQALENVLDYRARLPVSEDPDLQRLLHEAAVKLRSLESHQLYLDGGKSYREFWEGGEASIALLQEATQRLRMAMNAPGQTVADQQLSDQHLQILRELAVQEAARSAQDLARCLNVPKERAQYLLDDLLDKGLLLDRLAVGAPTEYQLSRIGRKFSVDRGMI
jgi:hypothetical protein